MKLAIGCKVLHYTLVEEKATWLQNPKAPKYAVASQEVYKFFVWVSVYDDDYKIMFLYHLVG